MKHYLDLIPISAKVHRKQSRMTRTCIVLAVFLVTVIFGMADMEMRCQKIQTIYQYGNWHAQFRQLEESDLALIAARPEVAAACRYQACNYRLDQHYQIAGTETVLLGLDEQFAEIFPAAALTEGSFCSAPDTAVVTESVQAYLNLQINDTVSLTLPNGETKLFTISGVTPTTAMLSKADAFGIFLSTDSYQRLLSAQATAQSELDSILYVQFSPFCNIQKTLTDIRNQFQLTEQQISDNPQLLTLLLQSRDQYMMQFYLVALILSLLVMFAGILMITGSLNSNLSQRTKFFGLLHCLGATEQQVRRFVRREALSWCKTALPLGILPAVLVIWLLCALLRFLSPNLFSGMPLFAISWPAIFMGAFIGLCTALLAARKPAKKAAKVSPLAAVSGNAEQFPIGKKAANTDFFPIQVALGVHHATASKKNFFLMVGSFAFSIILFLSFSTTIDFMQHALTPLYPGTPDFSIIATDHENEIPCDLEQQLGQLPIVKASYGRSISKPLAVQINGVEKQALLISYEATQFQWAKQTLLEGDLSQVQTGQALLAVFQQQDIAVKDTVCFADLAGCPQYPIGGIVSKLPFQTDTDADIFICSEALFQQLIGAPGYAVLDLQFEPRSSITKEDLGQIRAMAGTQYSFSDRRLKNQEIKGAYYAMSLFLYGFLAVIVLISIFNMMNTMSMSVSARLEQYGAMRAIGMSDRQVLNMIGAEACTYTLWGIALGSTVGLLINRSLFQMLVTDRWGDVWTLPTGTLCFILAVVCLSALLSIVGPAQRIRRQTIIDTIHAA